MRILAIDDDQVSLSVLSWILKQDGHDVTVCNKTEEAIPLIQPDLDLVISDVNMPGLNGFELAQLVSKVLGDTPPRTLLISGEDHSGRVAEIPPDQIIGLVDKPISLGHMHRIVRLIEHTRRACPGNHLPTSCPLKNADAKETAPEILAWSRFCQSKEYALCPLYNGNGGKALRAWLKELPPPLDPQI